MNISPLGSFPGSAAIGALQVPQQNAQTDFTSTLSKVAIETLNTIKDGETVAMDGLAGRAGIQDVVESVMAAERSFSTALAVRDKIVSAYLELSRMTV